VPLKVQKENQKKLLHAKKKKLQKEERQKQAARHREEKHQEFLWDQHREVCEKNGSTFLFENLPADVSFNIFSLLEYRKGTRSLVSLALVCRLWNFQLTLYKFLRSTPIERDTSWFDSIDWKFSGQDDFKLYGPHKHTIRPYRLQHTIVGDQKFRWRVVTEHNPSDREPPQMARYYLLIRTSLHEWPGFYFSFVAPLIAVASKKVMTDDSNESYFDLRLIENICQHIVDHNLVAEYQLKLVHQVKTGAFIELTDIAGNLFERNCYFAGYMPT